MNLSWLLPDINGIPVLMYHNVIPGRNDALCISPEKLREQWLFLKQEGYEALSLANYLEIVTKGIPPARKAVLLTFDDGPLNNYEYVYPLLREMGWRATFFIIADTLSEDSKGEGPHYNDGQPKMSLPHLRQLDPAVVQLAMHGYHHEHFDQLTLDELKTVFQKSIKAFDGAKLPYYKMLAYPYGSRPKIKNINVAMKQWMSQNGIVAAFRIGNEVSRIPAPDIYELKRIDIKGTDTLAEFRIKLKKGKLKPF